METTLFFRKGNKVALRPIRKEDATLFVTWINDPEVTQYLATNEPLTLKDEEDWLERMSIRSPYRFLFSLVDVGTNALIGNMSINGIDYKSGTATTGSVIGDKSYWGKGYGTEAKMLLLQFAFEELNLRKIYSEVISYNERSYAYAQKCGYVEEARIPSHFYRKGKYWDRIILAVYREHWEKLWKEYRP